MLTFFRRIRKGLLGDGATSKYLLYAIGEIALVVIGILIALQINNWNEGKKDRIKEKAVLLELVKNLEFNCKTFREQLSQEPSLDQASNIVIPAIKNRHYTDSLERYFHLALWHGGDFLVSFVGYESLKNTGFDIIRNDLLKEEIVFLFEYTYPLMERSIAWEGYDRSARAQYMDEQFLMLPGGQDYFILRPYDFNNLMNDQYFFSLLNKVNMQRDYFMMIISDGLEKSQGVLQLIKDELGESD